MNFNLNTMLCLFVSAVPFTLYLAGLSSIMLIRAAEDVSGELTSTTECCDRGLNRRLLSPWANILPPSWLPCHPYWYLVEQWHLINRFGFTDANYMLPVTLELFNQKNFSTWDVMLLIQIPEPEERCVKCGKVAIAPHTAPCGHTYCGELIDILKHRNISSFLCIGEDSDSKDGRCPKTIAVSDLLLDKAMCNQINKKMVNCPNRKCNHVCKLKQLKKHLTDNCTFERVSPSLGADDEPDVTTVAVSEIPATNEDDQIPVSLFHS